VEARKPKPNKPPRKERRDLAREARMCELFTSGHTLQQIATVYGISRERVRQIVARHNMRRADGGAHKKSEIARERRRARLKVRRDAASMEVFGCDYETLLRLNDGRPGWSRTGRARQYLQQRRSAGYRGIEWRMTFPEWWEIWEQSGHYADRGRGREGYVMARQQDFGPYAAWNVYIVTGAANVTDYQAELKRRGVVCKDGYKRLPERALELGIVA
jgi:DNA-binding CsgD family transcriptional regulator